MALPTNLPQTANMQGFWKMDEASGNRADETDNSNTLTDTNTVGNGTAKIGAYSADFERDNSEYLTISDGDQTGLDITSNLTICSWVKLETNNQLMSVVSKWGGGGDKCYLLIIWSDNKLSAILTTDGTTDVQAFSTDTLSTGTWYHIALVFDDTANTMTLYINGLANGTPQTFNGSIHDDASTPFDIGDNLASNFFDGLIDEVIVWNTNLTPTEVLAVKNITEYKYPSGGGFSGFSPWTFMKEAWEKHDKLWKPKGILIPKGI